MYEKVIIGNMYENNINMYENNINMYENNILICMKIILSHV